MKNSEILIILSNLKSLKLTINAPGRKVTDTFSRLICIDRDNFEEEVSLPVDPNFYEGSRRVEFGAIGDVLGPAVSRIGCERKKMTFSNFSRYKISPKLSLNQLIDMPMGCGEQNLAKMMPNILILEYLNVSRSKEEFDEGLRKTLIKNIKQGYLNQG